MIATRYRNSSLGVSIEQHTCISATNNAQSVTYSLVRLTAPVRPYNLTFATGPRTTMLHTTLFESVFNSSPFGHYLLSPTPDAIILAVNDAFLRASGVP